MRIKIPEMRKIDYTKIPCITFLSCVAFIPFCTSRTKLFYLNLHDFAIKIIHNTKLLICNVFWSIFRHVFQSMKSVALISSKLQKCGNTGWFNFQPKIIYSNHQSKQGTHFVIFISPCIRHSMSWNQETCTQWKDLQNKFPPPI